jgi:glutamate-1-semialdehyde 2,1-aminomutase
MASPDPLTASYEQRHPRSAEWNRRARAFFAAEGATHFARVRSPFRPDITHAQGSRKWDVDGNEYIDYVMGHGALVLGHSHPAIVDAIVTQAAKGVHFGDNHPLEVEWAARIQRLMPAAERIEYFASGQEANQMGIRLARAFTGRKRLLKFTHDYHGWADELAGPGAAGTLAEHVGVIPPNDLAAVERELASEGYAVVLIEAGGARLSGRVPIEADFFRGLPALARRYGTVLLLDEVVTGFREAPGGWQSVVGMTPDLTSVGKAVSGGLPSGVLLGRAEVMRGLGPGVPPDRMVAHGGTWNAVPITCAAGIAACDLYRDGAPQRTARLMADRLKALANERFERLGAPARLYGRSVLHVYLGSIDRVSPGDLEPPTTDVAQLVDPARTPRYKRFDLHLLERGIASTRGEALTLSAAHTDRDVEETADALEAAMSALMQEDAVPAGR